MSELTIKVVGSFKWFSPNKTKPSYGNVINALRSHISYILSKADVFIGNVESFLRKAEKELERLKNPRVGLKFFMAVPNGWSGKEAIEKVKSFLLSQFNIAEENLILAFHNSPNNKHVHVLIFPKTKEGKKLRIGRAELRAFHKAWEELLKEEGYEIFKLPRKVRLPKLSVKFLRKHYELYRSYKEKVAEYRKALEEELKKKDLHGRGLPNGKPESAFEKLRRAIMGLKSFSKKQREEIEKLIKGLGFKVESKIAIVCTAPDKKPIQRVIRVSKLFEEDFLKFLRKLNSDGYNIYISVNELKEDAINRKKESFKEKQKHIYLDIDGDKLGKDGFEILNRILKELNLPKPSVVIQTSKANIQVVWTLEKKLDNEAIEKINSFLAERYGLDPATDISRVFRLAGFYNRKPGKGNFVYVFSKLSSLADVPAEPFLKLLELAQEEQKPKRKLKEVKTEVEVSAYRKALVQALSEELIRRGFEDIKDRFMKALDVKPLKSSYNSKSELEEAVLYRLVLAWFSKVENLASSRILALREIADIFRQVLKKLRYEKLEKSKFYPEISVSNAYKLAFKETIDYKALINENEEREDISKIELNKRKQNSSEPEIEPEI